MGISKCEACGKEIASNARLCTYCSRKLMPSIFAGFEVAYGFLLILFMYFLFIAHAGAVMEGHPRHRFATPLQRAAAGAMVLRKLMIHPESFKLDSALIVDGTNAVCYRYLSKDILGRMTWGLAVLEPDGKFMTSEARSFHGEWRRECAGRSGKDIAKSIQWIKIP